MKNLTWLLVKLAGKPGKVQIRTMFSITEPADDVIFESIIDRGIHKGVITLNRPKALNALNLSMVNKLYPTLQKWESEKSLVLVKGIGGRAFCAGGDVRAIVEERRKGKKTIGQDFFRTEYLTNALIGSYKVPYIAFIDGIVMGGGVGLSVHGAYRVATERTLFAMPETQIGLFPDVGGSYFLPRLNGSLGVFLALTGHRLKGVDVLKAGIATHFCSSDKLSDLEQEIIKGEPEKIGEILEKFNSPIPEAFSLTPYLQKIDTCFSAPTIEEILDRLAQDKSEWALSNLKILKKMSPTSLKITLKELQLGANMSLFECLQMEYRLAYHCLDHSDFYEGVRALLIDKDLKPAWKPHSISDVTQDLVDRHFLKVPDDKELKHKL